jgi:hypothetical protein
MSNETVDRTVFLTWVYSSRQKGCARLLVDSIRSFGGTLSECPIWLFETNPSKVPCNDFENLGVKVLPLSLPDSVEHYAPNLAHKVVACARAEELAPPEVKSLIWLSPETMIVQPPLLFDLSGSFDAAVRPVHIKNIGLGVTEPVDGFWRRIYEAVGVRDVQTTVESFVDAEHLRAYFNSAAFAANPATGLFRRWFECFEALVNDQAFQSGACADEWHKLFLHQAVLSTLVVTALDMERVRALPPDYGYPYNLHDDVPQERRATALNDLVHVIYEHRSVDPEKMDGIEVNEPLRTWLSGHANTYPT